MPRPRRSTKARKSTPSISLPRPRKGRRLNPGICRVDQPSTGTHGYVVRVGYRLTKKGYRPRYHAYFSDTRYGGKSKALASAQLWLKGLIKAGRPPKRAEP